MSGKELDVSPRNPPLDLDDDLFGRGESGRAFISSKMRGGILADERAIAVKTLEMFAPLVEPWCWEHNAPAGPYYAEEICIRYARTSDLLILILSDELTPVTRMEYEAAKAAGAQCYIFIKQSPDNSYLPHDIIEFERRERDRHAITRKFCNVSELQSLIMLAVRSTFLWALRERIQRTRAYSSTSMLMVTPNTLSREPTFSGDEAEAIIEAAGRALNAERPNHALTLIRQFQQAHHASNPTPHQEAWLLNAASLAQHRLGQHADALRGLKKMQTLGETLGDLDITATALQNLGTITHNEGDYEDARRYYRESFRLKSEAGDYYGIIEIALNRASMMIASDAVEAGIDKAENLLKGCEPIIRALKDPQLLANYQAHLGIISARRKEYHEAEQHMRRALRNARRTEAPGLEISIMQNLGKLFDEQERCALAIRWYSSALNRVRDLQLPFLEILLHRSRAETYNRVGRTEAAITELTTANEIAISISSRRHIGSITAALGQLEAGREDFDRAAEYFSHAVESFQSIDDTVNQAQCLALLASAIIHQGDPNRESGEMIERAVRVLPKSAHRERATILRQAAEAWHGVRNNVQLITQYYVRSLDDARNIEDLSTLAWLTMMAAAGIAESGGAAESISIYTDALMLFHQLDDPNMMFHVRNDRAIQSIELERFEEAREDIQECLVLAGRLSDRVKELQASLNRGELERRTGNLNESVSYSNRALNLARLLGDITSEAHALGNLGILLFDNQQLNEAEKVFQSLRALTQSSKLPAEEATALGGLAGIEFVRGHYGRAVQYYRRAAKLTENLKSFQRNRAEDIAGLVQSLSARGCQIDELQESAQLLVDLSQAIGETKLASSALANSARLWLARDEQQIAVSLYASAIILAGSGGTHEPERSAEISGHAMGVVLAQMVYHVREMRADIAESEFIAAVFKTLDEEIEGIGSSIREVLTSIQEVAEDSDPHSPCRASPD